MVAGGRNDLRKILRFAFPEAARYLLRRDAISTELAKFERDIASAKTSPKSSWCQLDAALLRWIERTVQRQMDSRIASAYHLFVKFMTLSEEGITSTFRLPRRHLQTTSAAGSS